MKTNLVKITQLTINNLSVQFTKNTLIYSKYNSTGKTTLIRLILFTLGFNVPSTKGIKFRNLHLKICINNGKDSYIVDRQNDALDLYKNSKYIDTFSKENSKDMLSVIFSKNSKKEKNKNSKKEKLLNPLIIDNILGTCYFDQDKGWTLLNRGKVIGNIRFNIERYLEGITSKNLSDYRNELKEIKNNISFYNNVSNLLRLNKQSPLEFINNKKILDNKLFSKRLKINGIRNQIKQIKEIRHNNNVFIRIINNYHLMVKLNNGKKIRLNKDNLSGYNINKAILDAQLNHLIRLEETEKSSLQGMEYKLRKEDLLRGTSPLEKFKQMVGNIDMTPEEVKSLSDNLSNKRSKLQKQVKYILKNSPAMNDLYDYISQYADELGVKHYIDHTPHFILTKNLKRYSGAILHLIVFAYRMGLLKLLEKHCLIRMPIIIDSPSTGELDSKNLKRMFNVLRLHFSNYQVIVASIHYIKSSTNNWSCIKLSKNLFTSLKNMNKS